MAELMGSPPGVAMIAKSTMIRIAQRRRAREEAVVEDADARQQEQDDRELEREPEGEHDGR